MHQQETLERKREYRLRTISKDLKDIWTVRYLHDLLFGDELWDQPCENTRYWLLWAELDAAGFCSAKYLPHENAVYLTRAGVVPEHRGGGLQRRLLRVREQWARSRGAEQIITYTSTDNYPSITNLIKAGYRFYEPDEPWVGEDVHYFYKELYYD
jgi:GNAT superfamily N-acetyltransferase